MIFSPTSKMLFFCERWSSGASASLLAFTVFNVDQRRWVFNSRCYQMMEHLPPLVFSVIKECDFTKKLWPLITSTTAFHGLVDVSFSLNPPRKVTLHLRITTETIICLWNFLLDYFSAANYKTCSRPPLMHVRQHLWNTTPLLEIRSPQERVACRKPAEKSLVALSRMAYLQHISRAA